MAGSYNPKLVILRMMAPRLNSIISEPYTTTHTPSAERHSENPASGAVEIVGPFLQTLEWQVRSQRMVSVGLAGAEQMVIHYM